MSVEPEEIEVPMSMTYPKFSVSVNREQMPTEVLGEMVKVPDEKWRYVDLNGHGHFWSTGELPTLEWVVTGKHWVGDEYDGQEYDVGEWRCRLCTEVIEPGYRLEQPRPIFGLTTVTVEFLSETAPNGREEFVLTVDQYAESLLVWQESLKEAVRR